MSYVAWFSLHINIVIILPLSGMLTSPEMRAPRGPERSVPGTPGPLLLSALWSWSSCLWIFFIQDDRSSLLAVGEQRENITHWLTMPAVAWFCLHDKFCDHAFYLHVWDSLLFAREAPSPKPRMATTRTAQRLIDAFILKWSCWWSRRERYIYWPKKQGLFI